MNRNQLYALAEGTPYIPQRLTKDKTVNLLYVPHKDVRFPAEFIQNNSVTKEGREYCEKNDLQGYTQIPVNQAAKILEQSKQFFRQ